MLWGRLAEQVELGTTIPGIGGWPLSFLAEILITFLLLTLILRFVDERRLQPYAAAAAGALVAFLVFVETPISGTSLNPARSLGPAVLAPRFTAIWVYLLAPPIGALLAVAFYRLSRKTVKCGKLFHSDGYECRFLDCEYTPPQERVRRPAQGTPLPRAAAESGDMG